VNTIMSMDYGLEFMRGGAWRVGESRSEIGTHDTLVHIPSMEDRYILLAILYMIIVVFTRESPQAESCIYLPVGSLALSLASHVDS
jgi:hypothetical protein